MERLNITQNDAAIQMSGNISMTCTFQTISIITTTTTTTITPVGV